MHIAMPIAMPCLVTLVDRTSFLPRQQAKEGKMASTRNESIYQGTKATFDVVISLNGRA